MGKSVRTFAFWLTLLFLSGFIFNPLASMFSEPFFEAVFDKIGWNTETMAGPFMSALANIFNRLSELFASSYFQTFGLIGIGFGAGVGVHWAATRADTTKAIQKSHHMNNAFPKATPTQKTVSVLDAGEIENPDASLIGVIEIALDSETGNYFVLRNDVFGHISVSKEPSNISYSTNGKFQIKAKHPKEKISRVSGNVSIFDTDDYYTITGCMNNSALSISYINRPQNSVISFYR